MGAALFIALTAAPGAKAQHLTAEPVLETAPAGPSILLTAQPSSAQKPVADPRPGFDGSERPYVQQDGSSGSQPGLVGNMSIAPALEFGVGLFPVPGDVRRRDEFKRNWSVREVTAKRNNIAAVGMRFQF